jgi:hypothetical protein
MGPTSLSVTSRPHAAVLVVVLLVGMTVHAGTMTQDAASTPTSAGAADRPALEVAQRLFYNGKYEGAAAVALELQRSDADALAAHELRTSAIHFQIRRALGEPVDKDLAFKACVVCPNLMTTFLQDIAKGQTLARARLQANAEDEQARFFLGKLNLNYVWLQLGTLGRRTGWNEFREARRSLDTVLNRNPGHVRAQVAHAWIDYIVDTKVPRLFRWVLGGGDKKRGLTAIRNAAAAETDFFTKVEAGFALWEMQIRERSFTDAVVTARRLALDFPENRELAKFLETSSPAVVLRPSQPIK